MLRNSHSNILYTIGKKKKKKRDHGSKYLNRTNNTVIILEYNVPNQR